MQQSDQESSSPYYLRAFQWTIQQAITIPKYSTLLTQQEKMLIGKFTKDLTEQSQRLWLRLFLRKSRKCFLFSSIIEDYKQEFSSPSETIENCIGVGFLNWYQDVESILRHCLTRSQLNSLYCEIFCTKDALVLKEDLIERLISIDRSTTCQIKPSLKQTKLCFTPHSNQIGYQSDERRTLLDFIRFKFGQFVCLNWQQEFFQVCKIVLLPVIPSSIKAVNSSINNSCSSLLESVILCLLGRITYPSFTIDPMNGIFRERREFDSYIEIISLYELMIEITQDSTKGQNSSDIILFFLPEIYNKLAVESKSKFDKYSVPYVAAKILTLIAGYFEKEKEFKKANRIYNDLLFTSNNSIHKRMVQREHWWKRLIINTRSHLSDTPGGLFLQNIALQDSTLPQYFIDELSIKNESELPTIELEMTEDEYESGTGKTRVTLLTEQGAKFNVENYVIQRWEDDGWEGVHCEGSLFTTITALLNWDILFNSTILPSTFQSPFQSYPLDLFTLDFYHKREKLIEEHFIQFINNPITVRLLLESNYFKYKGISCIGVDWNLNYNICEAFIIGMDEKTLVTIMRWILQDWRRMTSGLPDLFMWRVKKEAKGAGTGSEKKGVKRDGRDVEILFLEVKSHNDNLSSKQICWIKRMLKLNLAVQVVKIRKKDSISK